MTLNKLRIALAAILVAVATVSPVDSASASSLIDYTFLSFQWGP
jgi:hypothetical protein